MKRLFVGGLCASLLFVGVACSNDAREDAAEDIRDSAQDAYEEGRDVAADAADRAEDIINDRTVRIDDLKFDPATRTVTTGTEVTWVNRDRVNHTVRAENDSFDSSPLETDKEFSFRFTQSGIYEYYCEIHGKDVMSGKVLVES